MSYRKSWATCAVERCSRSNAEEEPLREHRGKACGANPMDLSLNVVVKAAEGDDMRFAVVEDVPGPRVVVSGLADAPSVDEGDEGVS